jgi:hypothetical protein
LYLLDEWKIRVLGTDKLSGLGQQRSQISKKHCCPESQGFLKMELLKRGEWTLAPRPRTSAPVLVQPTDSGLGEFGEATFIDIHNLFTEERQE